ncbi:MAG: HAD family hydrolase [bacterium]|jgi:phosphoglycolate phosphatase-like HAD superfamily hydrolase
MSHISIRNTQYAIQMLYKNYISTKQAFIFDLDNTLYPEKDYLYQIYYMIGQFVEYQETFDHDKITKFLIDEFEQNGRKNLFNKLIERFALSEEYMENFLRLMRTGRLPLRLMLYKEIEILLNELVDLDKKIFILTNGNPEQQYNKIIQIDWNGLQQYIKCYFANEIKPKPAPDAMLKIIEEHELNKEEIIFIGDSVEDEECAKSAGVEFCYLSKLFV